MGTGVGQEIVIRYRLFVTSLFYPTISHFLWLIIARTDNVGLAFVFACFLLSLSLKVTALK